MTGLERVLSALKGEKTDRPPFTLLASLYGASLTNCSLTEYYHNPDAYMAGMKLVVERFNPDILFTPFIFPFEGAAFGSKMKYFKNYPPNVSLPAYNSVDVFLSSPLPDENNQPYIEYMRSVTRSLVSGYSKEHVIAGVALSPVDLPVLIFGLSLWLETVLFNESQAIKIIEKLVSYSVSRINAFFDDGALVVVLPVMFCNPSVITRPLIDRIGIPYLTRTLEQVKGPVIIHHVGTRINSFAQSMMQLPNTVGICVDTKDDMRETRKLIGDTKLILGNLDGPTLSMCTKVQAVERTKRILEMMRYDPHYVFTTSAADIPYDTPPEILDAVVETIRSFS